MTTRFEEIIDDMGLGDTGPCLPSSLQYLRDLKASHEALLRALREAHPYVPDHHGPVQHKINEAIRRAEGLEK